MMRIAVDFTWVELGPVVHDGGRLRFPQVPEAPGIYLFDLGDKSYIGETDRLRRRFQHYRTPGPTQVTNVRLNALMTKILVGCGAIMVSTITAPELEIDGVRGPLSLVDKEARLLVENAALVACRASGRAVENL